MGEKLAAAQVHVAAEYGVIQIGRSRRGGRVGIKPGVRIADYFFQPDIDTDQQEIPCAIIALGGVSRFAELIDADADPFSVPPLSCFPTRPAVAQIDFFGNFVVGPTNSLAREASLAIATHRHSQLQKLYLYSGSGLGKTHLARAVTAESG